MKIVDAWPVNSNIPGAPQNHLDTAYPEGPQNHLDTAYPEEPLNLLKEHPDLGHPLTTIRALQSQIAAQQRNQK